MTCELCSRAAWGNFAYCLNHVCDKGDCPKPRITIDHRYCSDHLCTLCFGDKTRCMHRVAEVEAVAFSASASAAIAVASVKATDDPQTKRFKLLEIDEAMDKSSDVPVVTVVAPTVVWSYVQGTCFIPGCKEACVRNTWWCGVHYPNIAVSVHSVIHPIKSVDLSNGIFRAYCGGDITEAMKPALTWINETRGICVGCLLSMALQSPWVTLKDPSP